jgi:hypothetical protein
MKTHFQKTPSLMIHGRLDLALEDPIDVHQLLPPKSHCATGPALDHLLQLSPTSPASSTSSEKDFRF